MPNAHNIDLYLHGLNKLNGLNSPSITSGTSVHGGFNNMSLTYSLGDIAEDGRIGKILDPSNGYSLLSGGGWVAAGIKGGKLYTQSRFPGSYVDNGKGALVWGQYGTDTTWTDVSCGDNHVLAIKSGQLWTGGQNGNGQLGTGNTTSRSTLGQIGTDTDWQAVSAGRNYSWAIKGGALYACGSNANFATGQNTSSGNLLNWTLVNNSVTWTSISAVYDHMLAVGGGEIYGCGLGNDNVFGNGSTATLPIVTKVSSSGTDFVKVFASDAYSKAIKTASGEHWHAGTGGSFGGGVRGDGSTTNLTTWTRIGADTGWTHFARTGVSNTSFIYYAAGIKDGQCYGVGLHSAPFFFPGSSGNTTSWFAIRSGKTCTAVSFGGLQNQQPEFRISTT